MKNWLRLLVLFKPFTGWILLGILASTITLLANIALMAVSGWFIASMALAGVAGISMNYFSPAAIIRGAAIFRTVGRYSERLITHEATFRLLTNLRVCFYQHLEPLVPGVLQDYRSGDILNRIRTDIDALENFYIRGIVPVSVAIIGIILTTLVMSTFDTSLALVLLGMLLLSGVALPLLIARLSQQPGKAAIEQSAELTTQVIDGIQGLAELTVCGALEQSANKVHNNSRLLIRAQQKMGRISGLSLSALILLTNLAMWFVVLLAIPLVAQSAIQPAELAMLVLFTLAAFESVMPLPEAFRLFGQVQTAASRLFEIIDRKPLTTEPAEPIAAPTTFSVKFEQVSFSYQPGTARLLTDIDFDLPAGKKMAVVGPTGVGKSSLIQLILRYRLASKGRVSIAGNDITNYSSEQLHDMIAVVPQQVHLFNTSIAENLKLANPSASQAQIESACNIAQIHEFIAEQPDGYDTWVGETGVKLSGGQARRVAIARALLRDFQLLVLDEPGEGLDTKTEKQMIDQLINTLGEKSLLLITHSHAGLSMMDEILVLEQVVSQ